MKNLSYYGLALKIASLLFGENNIKGQNFRHAVMLWGTGMTEANQMVLFCNPVTMTYLTLAD